MAKKKKNKKSVFPQPNTNNQNGGGRDWFDGRLEEVVVSKLKDAFQQGANVVRACAYAEILRVTYYEYIKIHPELTDIFEMLRQKPVLKAESVVIKKLNEDDVDTAKWYLERKAKGEYSTRQEMIPVNPDEDDLSEEEKEKLRKILRENSK